MNRIAHNSYRRKASALALPASLLWIGSAVCLFLVAPVATPTAQAQNAAFEMEELKIALQAATAKAARLEREVAEIGEKNDHLGQALAAANAEGEHFRLTYQKLRERMEALGISAIDPDPSSLQARYLKALSDYRLTREENDKLVSALGDLNASVAAYMGTAISSSIKERLSLEVAIREANQLVGGASKPKRQQGNVSLENAKVVSLKSDYDLVVLNVGRDSGVQVGMPFQIHRKDRPIGSALVIDVRDHICGVVIKGLADLSEGVKLGDNARVDATTPQAL